MKKLREHDLKKVLKEKPQGATHYDTFWRKYLKVQGDELYFMEKSFWYESNHRDGVDMVTFGECLCLSS
jgi:hypothetical protein